MEKKKREGEREKVHVARRFAGHSESGGKCTLHFALGAKVLCHFYLATRKYSLKVEI